MHSAPRFVVLTEGESALCLSDQFCRASKRHTHLSWSHLHPEILQIQRPKPAIPIIISSDRTVCRTACAATAKITRPKPVVQLHESKVVLPRAKPQRIRMRMWQSMQVRHGLLTRRWDIRGLQGKRSRGVRKVHLRIVGWGDRQGPAGRGGRGVEWHLRCGVIRIEPWERGGGHGRMGRGMVPIS